ncbi:tumor necrosis factor receptor superfamily member 1B [Lampris incognitus]|uniref:tumor necrosis factor receptor superfamily member 1B n=1 Tax=Lampris incognitus TaxID=2546036 RepID=UPI0024B566BE|nr:tumor necrosis factor receptor superfamily member 1B [Lampris incognitus]
MKSLLLLVAILRVAETTKPYSLPYHADSNGLCQDPKTEYVVYDFNLCCSRCPPGNRLLQKCTNTTDSVCKPCPGGQYIVDWNYNPNCFSCSKCKSEKGLEFAQRCSSTIKSTCVCQPGMYCVLGFDDPYCEECRKYKSCKPGQGVILQGTALSNVKCAPCPNGTFSDKPSYNASCQPHSTCHGRAVVKKGDPFSDIVCELLPFSHSTMPQIPSTQPQTHFVYTTASPLMPRVSSGSSATLSASLSVPVAIVSGPTKTLPQGTDMKAVAIGTSVIGLLTVLVIIVVVLLRRRMIQKKESEIDFPKVEANGNGKEGDNNNQVYLVDAQLTSSTTCSLEQQCLLETEDPCSSPSQGCHDAEPLKESCCGQECRTITAIPSTIPLNNTQSFLSEPMPLLSITEPISPESVPPQPTSQPTSPQLISPVTNNPHVNVNITFHIGNGSCGALSIIPKDSTQTNPDLPVGKEEECCSIPQQEAGKQSLMAVQESVSYD